MNWKYCIRSFINNLFRNKLLPLDVKSVLIDKYNEIKKEQKLEQLEKDLQLEIDVIETKLIKIFNNFCTLRSSKDYYFVLHSRVHTMNALEYGIKLFLDSHSKENTTMIKKYKIFISTNKHLDYLIDNVLTIQLFLSDTNIVLHTFKYDLILTSQLDGLKIVKKENI